MAGLEQTAISQHEALAQETSRLFFELPFIGMAVTSPGNKTWLRVNQTLCDMLGYTREELLQKTWAELTHPEDRKRDVDQFEAILRGESEGHKQDKRYFHRSGAIVHTVIDVKAVRQADGAVKFFVATIADVTARVNAEAAAHRSTALMTKLARQVPGVLYQLQQFTDGRVCCPFASEGIQEMYEVSAEALREDASSILDRIDPEDRGRLLGTLQDSARTLAPWNCEYRLSHSQRGLRWLRSEARPEGLPDGSTLWHGFTTDITERHLEQLALRESEERFRLQTEYAPEAILAFDPKAQRFVDANSKAETMFGLTKDQLLKLGWQDLDPPSRGPSGSSKDAFTERVHQALAGESVTFEWAFQAPTGAALSCEVRLSCLPYQGQQLVRASVTDISDRLRQEDLLRTSEERLMQALQCTGAGIFDNDLVNGSSYWSPEMYQICDVDADATVSLQTFLDRLHPDERSGVQGVIAAQAADEGDGRIDRQMRLIWRNGDERRLAVRTRTSFAQIDGELRPARRIGAVIDITEEHRAHETLLTLQTAVESSLSIVSMADLEGKLTYVNQAFLNLWGYKGVDEVLGKHVSTFWTSKEESAEVVAAVQATGYWSGERIARRADRSERTLQLSVSLFRDSQGTPAGLLGSFVDITESKSLQAQLLQSQKMESIGRLAGGIAHDFNNLLTVIKGYLELATLALPDDNPVVADLSEVDRAADLAAELTQQLLAFSRRQIIDPMVLDLNTAVNRAHGMLKRVLGENILLVAQTDPNLWPVFFDRGQAEQILLNLAVNARDAMPDGGRLTLETCNVVLEAEYLQSHPGVTAGEFVMLAVSDTGEGMDAETKAHAFEPFYTTKKAGKGTGLGLAVLHGAVSQNGGRVELYSEPGHGTSFKIYLPRARGKAAATPERRASKLPRGTETIMLAEDDAGVRHLAMIMLESFGYKVHAFAEPTEALAWLAESLEPIDALLTDVIMPGMNGKELAEQVIAKRPNTKVLFVSGYTANVIVHHGVLKPGVEFLAKPYSRDSLARRIRQILDT